MNASPFGKNDNILTLVQESKSLNPEIFSLIRMQLMSNLADLGEDGSTLRELKAVLGMSDGALHSNLKALEGMGYIQFKEVKVEDKNLKSCHVTKDGKAAWEETRKWMMKLLHCKE